MPYIYGRHSVFEALREQQPLQKIYIQHGAGGEKIRAIFRLARLRNIPVTTTDARKLLQILGKVNHQGVMAVTVAIQTQSIEELLNRLLTLDQPPCLLMVDRIQDPHNLGAIIRSAEVMGAHGLIYSARGNAPITDAVIKASAGATLHLPLYKTGNLAQALLLLKEKDLWIYGTSTESQTLLWEMDFTQGCVIIIGNEEKGIRPGLQKNCDQLFKIPQFGKIESLNAAVAAGIVLAELVRQRKAEN